MTIINPYMSAARRVDKAINNGIRARKKFAERKKNAKAYLEAIHKYKLVGNYKDLDQQADMTGSEAYAQNEVLKQIYCEEIREAIDAGIKFGQSGAVLKRWVLDQPKEAQTTN